MSLIPKKHFGQHFLNDPVIAQKIVNCLTNNASDKVLEIGPGKGALTKFLIKKRSKIKLIEIDQDAITILQKKFPKTEIINTDFLKLDLSSIGWNKYVIIGNFPYNISTQILFRILENRDNIVEVVGMFQKEVGDRICSSNNSKKYGIPSVLLQAFFKCEKLFDVSPEKFEPIPKVNSSVIKLTRNNTTDLGCNYVKFEQIVKMCFSQRRKKIKNALKNFINLVDSDAEGLSSKRAEQLTVSEFIDLTNAILKIQNEFSTDKRVSRNNQSTH